jgi:hypothetical protein
VLSRLAYLLLCRSIQLLALLARSEAAKDLRSSSCVTNSPCSAAKSHVPSSNPPTELCSLQSAGCYPEPAGPAS